MEWSEIFMTVRYVTFEQKKKVNTTPESRRFSQATWATNYFQSPTFSWLIGAAIDKRHVTE